MAVQKLPLQQYLADDQSVAYKYRIMTASFGDGYAQVAPDGINNESREVTFRYQNLTIQDFNKVMNFLRALKGVTPFSVKLHGENATQNYRLNPQSLQTSVTAKHMTDASIVYRTITFSATTCFDIGL